MSLGELDEETVLAAAAVAAGLSDLTRFAELARSGRTVVWRVSDGRDSFVLKAYLSSQGNGWAREASALEAASSSLVSSNIIAVCADPQLILMNDLGVGHSLADALLGDDSSIAQSALDAWASGLARLHTAPVEVAASYGRALSGRADSQPVHDKPRALGEAADKLQLLAPEVGVDVSDAIVDRLSRACEGFAVPADVLSPGDTCPDNNLIRDEHVTFLDFEFAEVRHLAWDVAYLRVPWPTCWCAWRLPPEVSQQAVDRYRDQAHLALPFVGSREFEHDLDLATLAWCLESAAMFLQGALSQAAAEETTKRRPGRRLLVQNRLAIASSLTVDPDLAELAGRLHAALLQKWGPLSLGLAPAFNG